MRKLLPEEILYLVVHDSGTKPRQRVNKAYMERVHRMQGRLWVGFHFVIDRKGAIEGGRSLDQIGAHAPGFDSQSIGICLAGGVDQDGNRSDNFTKDQRESLTQLVAYLHTLFPRAIPVGYRDLPNVVSESPSLDVQQFLRDQGYVQPLQSMAD